MTTDSTTDPVPYLVRVLRLHLRCTTMTKVPECPSFSSSDSEPLIRLTSVRGPTRWTPDPKVGSKRIKTSSGWRKKTLESDVSHPLPRPLRHLIRRYLPEETSISLSSKGNRDLPTFPHGLPSSNQIFVELRGREVPQVHIFFPHRRYRFVTGGAVRTSPATAPASLPHP